MINFNLFKESLSCWNLDRRQVSYYLFSRIMQSNSGETRYIYKLNKGWYRAYALLYHPFCVERKCL